MTSTYEVQTSWSGSTAAGYRHYSRDHRAQASPAPGVDLSADPHFLGNAERLNPEQLLVMAASSCQMLSFLAVAARARVDVVGYRDRATSTLSATAPVRLELIELRPVITIAGSTDPARVRVMAYEAHAQCYIAHSLSARVTLDVTVTGG